ncbi:hypothetical protein FB475_1946 [Kribbella jejuensis]|uniref:Uncharacterized protein n=1 Tax=Kribbella jejuensis TaxID=236068 RepID=A0A542ER23_9ACTN|nr:hypothetical protein FB475_1946 [Kribbella jejuensis]
MGVGLFRRPRFPHHSPQDLNVRPPHPDRANLRPLPAPRRRLPPHPLQPAEGTCSSYQHPSPPQPHPDPGDLRQPRAPRHHRPPHPTTTPKPTGPTATTSTRRLPPHSGPPPSPRDPRQSPAPRHTHHHTQAEPTYRSHQHRTPTHRRTDRLTAKRADAAVNKAISRAVAEPPTELITFGRPLERPAGEVLACHLSSEVVPNASPRCACEERLIACATIPDPGRLPGFRERCTRSGSSGRGSALVLSAGSGTL